MFDIIFSLLLPVVILGIVGLNDGEVDPVEIGLVDNSNSVLSKNFITKLSDNPLFTIIEGDEEVEGFEIGRASCRERV